MKRFYALLPRQVAQRVRNVLEFDGGVTDTHVTRAGTDADDMLGFGPDFKWRPAPGSMPQPRVPVTPAARVYDIKYYPRDVRRNPDPTNLPIEASFSEDARKGLEAPKLIDAPKTGSPGVKNPDVERYDPTGLRSAMTTTHTAVAKELSRNRAEHLPVPAWERDRTTPAWMAAKAAEGLEGLPGRPGEKRTHGWPYTHVTEW